MRRQRIRKREKMRRMIENAMCGFFVLVAYAALGYAVAMDAFFDAPHTWTNIMAVLSFALQIVVIMMLKEMDKEVRRR